MTDLKCNVEKKKKLEATKKKNKKKNNRQDTQLKTLNKIANLKNERGRCGEP